MPSPQINTSDPESEAIKLEEPPPPSTINLEGCDNTKKISLPSNSTISSFKYTNKCEIKSSIQETKNLPLDILILLDVSGSMQKNIDTIRDHIDTFIASLRTYTPRIGLIPFVDNIQETNIVPLTENTRDFLNVIHRLTAKGGGKYDYQEAGLLAIETALTLFKIDMEQNPAHKNARKVLLVITNSASHRGDSSTLDSTITIQRINEFTRVVNNFSLFYSIPTFDNTVQDPTTLEFIQAHNQYRKILTQSNNNLPIEERGGLLSYPFQADTLLNEFKDKLTTIVDKEITLSCLPQKAFMVTIAAIPSTLDLPINLKNSLNNSTNQQTTITLNEPITRNISDNYALTISRCCGTLSDLEIEKCKKTWQQTFYLD